MNALRIERLIWAVVFAALVALVVAFVLVPAFVPVPDLTGVVPLVVALVTFAAVAPIAARLSLGAISADEKPGDQTVQYVVFFVVAVVGQVALGSLGYEGTGPSLFAFAAGWLAATKARRLNPRRWNREAAA
ncbi:hypothetical protein [Halobellus rarus]|uniref:Uncharacterized protein n=1 Tax=Halobellus rarus TaxID=1126237 RepID=A0ABD6CLI6_9EURY|nr:hypothetical protein [Halobellus rarus]